MEIFLTMFATIFGLLIGSFLNALIYRLPRNINIAYPRSSCTNCKKVITWYENIPVLSYLFLRGKCSGCHSKISIEYPIVELLCAVIAYVLAPKDIDPISLWKFFFSFSVFSCFLAHFIIDIKHQILPDSLNLYLAILFLANSLLLNSWMFWISGALIGIGFPFIISWIFYQIKGQIGLGGGDIKLFGALGIFLGPLGVLQNIFLSCFLGAVIGIILIALRVIKKENPIPFGPFIIVVGAVQFFYGHWLASMLAYIP